jgi:hypothetical protein
MNEGHYDSYTFSGLWVGLAMHQRFAACASEMFWS